MLIAIVGTTKFSRVDDLIPIVLCGVPGMVLTIRAPIFGVSFGERGVQYSGLLRGRSYTWPEIQEVRSAVVPGTLFSADVPELALASGGTDQLPMLAGYGWGRKTNKRVGRIVTRMERARIAALSP